MQWSQLKKRTESHFADSIKGRIKIGSTSYHHAHDEEGRGYIQIDGKEIINMCSYKFYGQQYVRSREEDREAIEHDLNQNNLFSQSNWHEALFDYLNLSIESILKSSNPLIRAMGMLDSRLGKRSLQKIQIGHEHELVKRLYELRVQAEGISNIPNADLTARLDSKWINKRKPLDKSKEQKIENALRSPKNDEIKALINKVANNKSIEGNTRAVFQEEVHQVLNHIKDKDFVSDVLVYLEKRSKLTSDIKYFRGVLNLVRDKEHWIKSIESWKPPSHNLAKQFSSLARSLLCEFDVPLFMDQAYLDGNKNYQNWFCHIGSGKNIREVESLPIHLTKKMAYSFLQAPSEYSIEGALRWAQIQALGGDRHLSDAILETRLVREFSYDEFWLSVIRFFIKNPMLDTVHVNPIIDYIGNKKFENRRVFVERGVARDEGPEQPNFSMKGRTVTSLLKDVENWHRLLGKETKSGKLQWEKSKIKDFEFIEGTEHSKNMKIWRIKELVASEELILEGRFLKHCVASYASSCSKGTSSIWSMTCQTEDEVEKVLTIELMNETKMIKQIRGKMNRLANDKEKNIILRWVEKEGLKLATYLI